MNTPRQIIDVIRSYLNNRTITFQHNSSKAEKFFTKGTPQGVLALLLWNILLDEFLHDFKIPNCELVAYADDVTSICWSPLETRLRTILKEAILKTVQWYSLRKLTLRSDKTNLLYLHCNQKRDITINENCIQPSNEIKILGVTFGDHFFLIKLDFKPHVKNITAKATRLKMIYFILVKKTGA